MWVTARFSMRISTKVSVRVTIMFQALGLYGFSGSGFRGLGLGIYAV